MTAPPRAGIFERLGVTPVINAMGHRTVLGGSNLSPRARAAMDETNRYYVDMAAMLEAAGRQVATWLGAEAATITTGASGGIMLGTAACLTGLDRAAMARLPEVAGPRRAVVIQASHRYKYDRCPEAVGARLRVAGDGDGTTPDQLAAALDGTAAAVLVPAHLDRLPGVVPLDGVIEIARRAGVPVLVDAAFHVYPLARMTGYLRAGADLVAFAAKYFQGPQSAGLLCGRRDLIAAAALQGFIGFETADTRSIGRAMKLDRQEVAATVVALEDWLALDHEARIDGYRRRLQAVAAPLADLPGVALAFEERDDTEVVVLRVGVAPAGDRTAAAVQAALRAGDPAVWVDRDGDDLIVAMPTVHPGDEAIVADRLRAALSGR